MTDRWSRRRWLRLVGASGLGSLAGCGDSIHRDRRVPVTPAPVPTDPRPPTPRRSDTVPRLSADAIDLDVEILAPSDEHGTARLAIAVRNGADVPLTAIGDSEFVVPFADGDRAGSSLAGEMKLLLLPDSVSLAEHRPGTDDDPIEDRLPEQATDGCWSVPFDTARPGTPKTDDRHAVTLRPAETRRHAYRLYFIDSCTPGSYSFQSSFLLAAGDSSDTRETYQALTGFHLGLTGSMELLLGLEEPFVAPISSVTDPSTVGASHH